MRARKPFAVFPWMTGGGLVKIRDELSIFFCFNIFRIARLSTIGIAKTFAVRIGVRQRAFQALAADK